ncbi:MAG: serine/threonine-protein kinase [Anaerolineae bacterium]
MPFTKGDQVGPYQIVEQLGQGGMATVYKAYHPQLDRFVAIKSIHASLQEEQDFIARFQREAQIIAKLEHPNIVPVYDYSENNNQPYIVMKFIDGHTLKDELDSSKLTLKQVLHVMKAVSSALTYAHQKGVLHRDVKPSNVMIDRSNIAYVSDFGLARIITAGETTLSANMMMGTPHYMSPEQALHSDLDARADIYSLGVMLYEMVVGVLPFSGDTPYAIIHEHVYTPLPLPSRVNPDIPAQVEEVLLKVLAKNPEDRYDSAVLLVRDFWKAVVDANWDELRPDRVQIASDSLAKMRQDLSAKSLAAHKADNKIEPKPKIKSLPNPALEAKAAPTISSKSQSANQKAKPKAEGLPKSLAGHTQPAIKTRLRNENTTKPVTSITTKSDPSLIKYLQRRNNVSDLSNQITDNRGGLERLIARIPGFAGYQDRQARRQADRLLRDYLSEQLSVRINRFVTAEKDLLESGGLALMGKTSAAKSKMQTYRDRVKAAAPGYSGFFEAIKIDSEQLEKIYSFDEAQTQYVDKLSEAIDAFSNAVKANQGIAEALDALEAVTNEANEAFTLREETLTNLDKVLGSN